MSYLFGIHDLSDIERAKIQGAIIDSCLDAVITMNDDSVILEWNNTAEELFGYTKEQAIGKYLYDLIIPDNLKNMHIEAVRTFKQNGRPTKGLIDKRIEVQAKNIFGNVFPIELIISLIEIRGVNYFSGRMRNISERKAYESRLELLIRELDHRVKNNLAIVLSIARQLIKNSNTKTFMDAFENRIIGLMRTHDLINNSKNNGVFLNKITCKGPKLWLNAKGAIMLGMMINEMTVNCLKYGALSSIKGTLKVVWTIDNGFLKINWEENKGPKIIELPTRKGFGTTLIKISMADLNGKFGLEFPESGLRGWIEIPLSSL